MKKSPHDRANRPAGQKFINTSLLIIGIGVFGLISPAYAQRIPPGDVLDRASKAWESVRDYQAILHQIEKPANGTEKELWARVSLVRTTKQDPDAVPTFRLDFYDHTIDLNPGSAPGIRSASNSQPLTLYYSDAGRKLYTYKPRANTLTIEWLQDHGPLPELMHLAGFLDFDIKTLKEKAYLDDEVRDETIDGTPTYRVRIVPRSKVREFEPARLIWIDRKSYFPKQFAVVGDFSITIEFKNQAFNQGLNEKNLVPEVPENVYVNDSTAKPKEDYFSSSGGS